MKPKPIIIAIIILAVAAVLIISSNRNGNGETDSNEANPTGTGSTTAGRARTPRAANGSSESQSTQKWEEQIDLLLGEDSTSHDKASRGLLKIALDKDAPTTVRNDALEHALNLVADRNHGLIQSVIGTGKNELPAELVQTILDDTLNRPASTQLTTALKILQGSHTSVIEEAIELLEFHLEEEHGTNVQKWTQSVDTFLAAEKNKPQQ